MSDASAERDQAAENGWTETEYEINQGNDPRVTVLGYVKSGVGFRNDYDDVWTITHLNTGLRIMEAWADALPEALGWAERVLAVGDWTINALADLPDDQKAKLCDDVKSIFVEMKEAFHRKMDALERDIAADVEENINE